MPSIIPAFSNNVPYNIPAGVDASPATASPFPPRSTKRLLSLVPHVEVGVAGICVWSGPTCETSGHDELIRSRDPAHRESLPLTIE